MIVFVTVCTRGHRRLLDNDVVHAHLIAAWGEADAWLVGRYVLMPDHLHLFCTPRVIDAPSVTPWMSFWKSRSAAAWPVQVDGKIWPRDGWDTQLRAGDNYSTKWEYVRRNPVRAGLVAEPDDWPYQGELNTLYWMGA